MKHSVAEVDAWEAAHFQEDEVRSEVKAAKRRYEDALRHEILRFLRRRAALAGFSGDQSTLRRAPPGSVGSSLRRLVASVGGKGPLSAGAAALSVFTSLIRDPLRIVRRQAPVFVAGAVLVGCVLLGCASLILYLHDRSIEESVRGVRTLSYILAQDVDRSLQSTASSVSEVVERLQSARLRSVDDLDALAVDKDVQAFARKRMAREPLLAGLTIVSVDGKLVAAAHPGGYYDERMSREYLDALRDAPADEVYLSTPLQNLDSVPGAGVSKRVVAADGAFLGVVSGFMKPSVFDGMFERSVLGKKGAIALLRTDGAVVTRVPAVELMAASDITGTAVYTQFIAANRNGVVREKSAIDGLDRILATFKSPNFPVATVVSVAVDDVLYDWRREAAWIAGGAGVFVLAIIIGLFKLADRINRLSDQRERSAVEAGLAVQYERFNNAIHNIAQGLAMFDARGNLIACNQRYGEIYSLPPKLMRPGVSKKQLFAHQGAAKALSAPREEPDGSVIVVGELPDGRVILQRTKKLADNGWVSTHEDITARHRAEEKIEEMATKDALTGLSNRVEFKQRLNQCLAEVQRKVSRFAVIYLDLDHFKTINDAWGHLVGDKLLQQVATRICATVRAEDEVARLGGDEFAIIQRVNRSISDPMRLAERLIAVVSEPFEIDGEVIVVGASVGVSMTPGDSVDSDELMRNAGMALYQSKEKGSGGYAFFEPSMDQQARARRQMEDDLRAALAENQFQLHFQPIVAAADRRVNSFEALLRWNHPVRGAVPPDDFIPTAEEMGLIVPIGEWVVREACKQAAKWPETIKIAVNISAAQFGAPGLVEAISAAIDRAGVSRFAAHRRSDRKRDDQGRRAGDDDTSRFPQARQQDRNGRFRDGVFESELLAPFPVRQDQDRSLVRLGSRRKRRCGGDRSRHHQHGQGAGHDHGCGRRRDGKPVRTARARRMQRNPGLLDRSSDAGRRCPEVSWHRAANARNRGCLDRAGRRRRGGGGSEETRSAWRLRSPHRANGRGLGPAWRQRAGAAAARRQTGLS